MSKSLNSPWKKPSYVKPLSFAAASRASRGVLPGVGLALSLRPLQGNVVKIGLSGLDGRVILRGPDVMGPSK